MNIAERCAYQNLGMLVTEYAEVESDDDLVREHIDVFGREAAPFCFMSILGSRLYRSLHTASYCPLFGFVCKIQTSGVMDCNKLSKFFTKLCSDMCVNEVFG